VSTTIGTGRIGISNPFVEGTPETRLAAHKERLSELRIAVARNRFFEVPAEHVETRRVGRVTYVVDTRSPGRVYEYLDAGIEVFAHGDHHVAFNEDAVAAFMVVGGEVVFLKRNRAEIENLEKLDQYESDLAYLAARKVEKAELKAGKEEQQRVDFRAKQPLRTVTLGDLEGRDLPTVGAAAQRILTSAGSSTASPSGSSSRCRSGSRSTRPTTTGSTQSSWTACVCSSPSKRSSSAPSPHGRSSPSPSVSPTSMSPPPEASRDPPGEPPA
jgi:hypothetical protein